MSTSNNPYMPSDRVQVRRGSGWLAGKVIKVVLARCHVELDSGKVVVDNYQEVRKDETWQI